MEPNNQRLTPKLALSHGGAEHSIPEERAPLGPLLIYKVSYANDEICLVNEKSAPMNPKDEPKHSTFPSS